MEEAIGEMRQYGDFWATFGRAPESFMAALPSIGDAFAAIAQERARPKPSAMLSMWRSVAPAYHVVELPTVSNRQSSQEHIALHA